MRETNLEVESRGSGVVATPHRVWLAWPANFFGTLLPNELSELG